MGLSSRDGRDVLDEWIRQDGLGCTLQQSSSNLKDLVQGNVIFLFVF